MTVTEVRTLSKRGYPTLVAGVDGGPCTGLGAITSVADKADSAFRAGATAPEAAAAHGFEVGKRALGKPLRGVTGAVWHVADPVQPGKRADPEAG
jgi:hypothetical protein